MGWEVRSFMQMVGWKDQEAFARELACRGSLGARARSRLLRATENLEAPIFPGWQGQVGRSMAPQSGGALSAQEMPRSAPP